MGSVNLADLSGLGTEVSGGLDGGGFGDGGAGMGNSNAYPVHDEYQTFTGQGGNIFENSKIMHFKWLLQHLNKQCFHQRSICK